MTPDERDLVFSLVISPGQGRLLEPAEFLERFGSTDGQGLGLELLRDAVERHDRVDVELALIVCGVFGITSDHLGLLLQLASADWHRRHEDVATYLGELRRPNTVGALYSLTQWVPEYLDFDESRALARKAVHALGAIPGEEAEQALKRLAGDDSEIIRERAVRQLQKRADS